MINWEEIIKKAIMNGVLQAVMIFRPYVIPVLTSALIAEISKTICKKFAYVFFIISGECRRMARKKSNRITDNIDLVSSFKDIFYYTKNRNT